MHSCSLSGIIARVKTKLRFREALMRDTAVQTERVGIQGSLIEEPTTGGQNEFRGA